MTNMAGVENPHTTHKARRWPRVNARPLPCQGNRRPMPSATHSISSGGCQSIKEFHSSSSTHVEFQHVHEMRSSVRRRVESGPLIRRACCRPQVTPPNLEVVSESDVGTSSLETQRGMTGLHQPAGKRAKTHRRWPLSGTHIACYGGDLIEFRYVIVDLPL
jgi:hypothetical protein